MRRNIILRYRLHRKTRHLSGRVKAGVGSRIKELSRKTITLRQVLLLFLMLTLNLSCTKADIMHRTAGAVDGLVQIYPDRSEHALPGLQYHFYNTDGATEYFCRESDKDGNFEGKLSVGTYRVIATNTAAGNVVFNGMSGYETAVVSAINRGETRNDLPLNYLSQPEAVYSVVVGELVVTGTGTVRHTPDPVLLTKRLTLVFTLHDDLPTEVIGLSGVLTGVYPFMQLRTPAAPTESVQQAVRRAVRFETEADGDRHRARINLFGLRDPGYGTVYTNLLTVDLAMTYGTTTTCTLDITEILSQVIEKNAGVLPPELSIPVKVRKTSIGIGVEAGEWVDEGEWNSGVVVN